MTGIVDLPIGVLGVAPDWREPEGPSELDGLLDSIDRVGIIQPLVVRADTMEVIAGRRRLRAASMLELETVPCVLVKTDDALSAEVTIAENFHRKNYTHLEQARVFKALMDAGHSVEQVSVIVGLSKERVEGKLELLRCSPEVQAKVQSGEWGWARATGTLSREFVSVEAEEQQQAKARAEWEATERRGRPTSGRDLSAEEYWKSRHERLLACVRQLESETKGETKRLVRNILAIDKSALNEP